MPPKASPYCKMAGCNQPRHIYPAGYKSQYCREHMRYRKSKQRTGHETMTGPMQDVLRYLRDMKRQGCEFVELHYPLAHGATLKHLFERDWIFESPGLDGMRYKITGRGLQALSAYEHPVQRRDGICPGCGERERHVSSSGRRISYCLECERERCRGKNRRARLRPGLCKKCKQQPKRQYSSGLYSDLCLDCDREHGRVKDRRERQRVYEAVASGAPVPVCVQCKARPRRVFANSVSDWCEVCGPKVIRKYKLRAGLRKALGKAA